MFMPENLAIKPNVHVNCFFFFPSNFLFKNEQRQKLPHAKRIIYSQYVANTNDKVWISSIPFNIFIYMFRTVVLILVVMFTRFRLFYFPAFFKWVLLFCEFQPEHNIIKNEKNHQKHVNNKNTVATSGLEQMYKRHCQCGC